MNTKKFLATGAVVLSGLALVGTLAFAQSAANSMSLSINDSGLVKLAGTVTAIAGSNLSVSSWGGTWVVNSTNAAFQPPNVGNLAEVKVGDMVKVQGAVSTGMNINATKILDVTIHHIAAPKDNDNEDHDHGWLNAMAKVKGFAWGLFGHK